MKKVLCLLFCACLLLSGCVHKTNNKFWQDTEVTKKEDLPLTETVPQEDLTSHTTPSENGTIDEPQDSDAEETAHEPETEFCIPAKDEMVEIEDFIPNIIIDLKYATTDNFTGQQIYDDSTTAMLRYGTVEKLANAQDMLNKIGLTLVIWDAYRPPEAQFQLWEVFPNYEYVANPNDGNFSSHTKGNTVDVTIVCLDGSAIEMPTGFDEFSKKADRYYDDVSDTAKGHALILEDIMIECGFKPYYAEWWHFTDTDNYDVYLPNQIVGDVAQ